MLKGIPPILSPILLKTLCEMGHSDTILIADGNFPVESVGKNSIVIRLDGHGVPEVLKAVLSVFPLDTYVDSPVSLMGVMQGDSVETPIWKEYEAILGKSSNIQEIERFTFYEKASHAYAIIATTEKALYANIMLQKGVI